MADVHQRGMQEAVEHRHGLVLGPRLLRGATPDLKPPHGEILVPKLPRGAVRVLNRAGGRTPARRDDTARTPGVAMWDDAAKVATPGVWNAPTPGVDSFQL
jgi:hypothetical protein